MSAYGFLFAEMLRAMRYAGNDVCMGTLIAVEFDQQGHRAEGVVKRLREQFAARRLSVSEVARRIDMTQPAMSRRMTGRLPFAVDELDDICASTGIDFAYITTGIREVVDRSHPRGAAPDHVSGAARSRKRLPRVDSNHQPSGLRLRAA